MENTFNEAKALASEMLDPPVNAIIDMIEVTVKDANSCIYIFIEMPVAFLNDTAKFLQELIQSINPACFFKISAQI